MNKCIIFEIFNFTNYRDLENWVRIIQGHDSISCKEMLY